MEKFSSYKYSKGLRCIDCGKLITNKATRCRPCAMYHVERVSHGFPGSTNPNWKGGIWINRRKYDLGTTGNKHYKVNKRDYPKDNKCELCGNVCKHLVYHHWDDKDLLVECGFVKGIWVCIPICHGFIEFIDKNEAWETVGKNYLLGKEKIGG